MNSDSDWESFGSRAAARRAAARALHPDLGGDSADFVAALTQIERTFARGAAVSPPIRVVDVRSAPSRWGAAVLHRTRRLLRNHRSSKYITL